MNCEAGTHSFQRGEGDDYGPSSRQASGSGVSGSVPGPSAGGASGDLRRKSFAAGEGMLPPTLFPSEPMVIL